MKARGPSRRHPLFKKRTTVPCMPRCSHDQHFRRGHSPTNSSRTSAHAHLHTKPTLAPPNIIFSTQTFRIRIRFFFNHFLCAICGYATSDPGQLNHRQFKFRNLLAILHKCRSRYRSSCSCSCWPRSQPMCVSQGIGSRSYATSR